MRGLQGCFTHYVFRFLRICRLSKCFISIKVILNHLWVEETGNFNIGGHIVMVHVCSWSRILHDTWQPTTSNYNIIYYIILYYIILCLYYRRGDVMSLRFPLRFLSRTPQLPVLKYQV